MGNMMNSNAIHIYPKMKLLMNDLFKTIPTFESTVVHICKHMDKNYLKSASRSMLKRKHKRITAFEINRDK